MAFHDVRLPEEVERGVVGGPQFSTTVLELFGGHEKRNINWEDARRSWQAGYGIQTKQDFAVVLSFFYGRAGKAHSFRFKDWSDYEMERQEIGTGDGVEDEFFIFKRYISGATNYDRDIVLPVNGTVQVWVNDVLMTEGADYDVVYTTGEVDFVVAPPLGQSIEVACEFDVPARFDTDKLNVSMETFDAGEIPNFPIIELRVAG